MAMISVHGTISREIPDPAHANDSPNWFKVTAKFPHTFDGETETVVFEKIRDWQKRSFYSTNNGVVPHFEFDDKEQNRRYYEWLRQNPSPVTSLNETF